MRRIRLGISLLPRAPARGYEQTAAMRLSELNLNNKTTYYTSKNLDNL